MKFILENLKIVSDNKRSMPIRMGRFIRIVSTKEYRECKADLTDRLLTQWDGNQFQDCEITVRVKTYKDILNIGKVLFDALEDVGIIKNDRYVLKAVFIKEPIKRNQDDYVEIEIKEYNGGLLQC